jgi:hypothetical protein
LAEEVVRPRWPLKRQVQFCSCTALGVLQEASWVPLGNVYEIYEQVDTPEIDTHYHFLIWVEFLEKQLGRELETDDFIFPHISVNGIIHAKKEIVHETIQKMLVEFTELL